MKEAENESHEGKKKNEAYWDIFRINFKRSRYIYEMYYKRKEISKELYEYLLREGYADGGLISKWKKNGYEKLCCLKCIEKKDHNFGTTCICRVPIGERSSNFNNCQHCGCTGCCSGD
jgi:bud site selection protein 31